MKNNLGTATALGILLAFGMMDESRRVRHRCSRNNSCLFRGSETLEERRDRRKAQRQSRKQNRAR